MLVKLVNDVFSIDSLISIMVVPATEVVGGLEVFRLENPQREKLITMKTQRPDLRLYLLH
jgi:hypothetical protein